MNTPEFEHSAARERISEMHSLLKERRDSALTRVSAAAAVVDRQGAQQNLDLALDYADLMRIASLPNDDVVTHFVIGSRFIREECFPALVNGEDEDMRFVTGLELGGARTLDSLVAFKLDKATRVAAVGNLASSHRALVGLEKYGSRLHGLFHRHPGAGAEATMPSGIDTEMHTRLEQGGHKAIGAIFTADGSIGFFTVNLQFDVTVLGQGVQRVGENIYRLS